ncbi:hypothetical protein ACFFX0_20320 [Citricoccus parietis]|uniref:Uncharacterized protein n=1 Tax=Citricoccus parietis TaxID=592307 RepID=A0ABV5G395_9MICC
MDRWCLSNAERIWETRPITERRCDSWVDGMTSPCGRAPSGDRRRAVRWGVRLAVSTGWCGERWCIELSRSGCGWADVVHRSPIGVTPSRLVEPF